MMPQNPIVGGTVLRIPAIQSPNFVPGVSGWTINADGTAQFNQLTLIVQTSGAAVLIYAGSAGLGTLIGSWASAAGTDQYGNAFPAGINAQSGTLTGILLTTPQIVGGTILNTIINAPQIARAAISAGTITETVITFDSGGGSLLAYSSSTTTVTQSASGAYTITIPTGVTSVKVECTGAGAGAGGGSTGRGGEGGGGGEYAAEPNYAVIPGNTYQYVVGSGGTGGITGSGGNDGGDSFFDGGGVIAQGGFAGSGFIGGTGGQYGVNTVSWAGGTGGGDGAQSTGGCGGGASAGSTSGGGGGAKSLSSTGGAGGIAGSGSTPGATGGNGGNNAANGSNGSSPGAGGGGAGAGSAVTNVSKQYRMSASQTYLGNGSQRGTSTMYQGGETAGGGSSNGIMSSMGIWPQTTIASDFSGVTVDSVTVRLENLHSWFNSGMSVVLGYTSNASLPSTFNGSSTNILNSSIQENQKKTFSLPKSYATALIGGSAKNLVIGPGPGNISNPNLSYYGFFYGSGGDNNQNPLLTINGHTGAGAETAGNGSDGQVKITYTSGNTLQASLAPVSGTDQFGNAYPAGLGVLQPSGQYVKVSGASTDTTTHTVTQTGNNQITNLWSIPSGDAAVGTIYRLTAWGNGTQATTTSIQLNTNLFLNGSGGTNIDNTNLGIAAIAAGQNFHWFYTVNVVITATGAPGSCVAAGHLTWSQAVATTPTNSATSAISDTGKAFTTSSINTLGLFMGWAATTNAPTITCQGSLFERLGP